MKAKFVLIFLFGLHIFLLLNLRFTTWPEMFAYPYLKNEGFLLYKDIIHPYPPLLTLIQSYIYKVFGYDLAVLQIFSWSWILLSSFFVYLNARLLLKKESLALSTLAIYVLLQPFLDGNMMWFDIAIVLPVSIGTFFALRWVKNIGDRKINLLAAGVFLALASLIKQTAGIFPLLFLIHMFSNKASFKSYFYFLLAPSFFLALFLGRLIQEGQLDDFWNWTLFYPLFHWSNFPGYVQMQPSTRELITLVWLCMPVVSLVLWKPKLIFEKSFSPPSRNQWGTGPRMKRSVFASADFRPAEARTKILRTLSPWGFNLIFLFSLGGLLAIYPRFSFFHFQPALIFFVLFYIYTLSQIKKLARVLVCILFFLFLIPYVYKPAFQREWQAEPRFYASQDKQLASLISQKIDGSQNIYLLGLPAQLYVMTGTVPPKPWTDNFGWYLEIPRVQEEILYRWDQKPPDFIVWRQPSPGNWFDLSTYQPKKIVQWIENKYTKREEIQPMIWLWQKKDLW